MGGRGGEDSTNSIGCSAHTQYMSTPLTTSLHSGSWAVGVTPPTLRCYCTVECITVHQHTLQTAPAVSLEDVDGADGTLDLTLLVGPLHCHRCLHNHVGVEVGITAGHWPMYERYCATRVTDCKTREGKVCTICGSVMWFNREVFHTYQTLVHLKHSN